jgi:hypothetical protein
MSKFVCAMALILGSQRAVSVVDVCFFVDQQRPSRHQPHFGKFFHVAIRLDQNWLQAHPYYGIHVGSYTPYLGPYTVLRNESLNIEPQYILNQYSQCTFELYSGWSNPQTTNCSNFIAKVLGVEPVHHGGDIETGFSPEELYDSLQTHHGFKPFSLKSCQKVLK